MTWNLPNTLENIPDEDHQQQAVERQQEQQIRDFSSDFKFLHQLLFQHVLQQKNEGVPIQEIENFLHDPEAVKLFFESRGCKFRLRSNNYVGEVVDGMEANENEIITEEETDHRYVEEFHLEPTENDEFVINDSKDVNQCAHQEANDVLQNKIVKPPDDIKSTTLSISKALSWLKRRTMLNLRKLMKLTKYVIIFTVITVAGHFGICHMLDVNPLQFFPALMERRCLIPTHPIIMEMTRPIADCRFCKENQGKQGDDKWESLIEMLDVPNKTTFAKVAYLSRPVIIRNGGRRGGMPDKFDFQRLKEIFESEPGGVDAVSEECQFLPFRSPFTTLREAFDKIGENSDWDEPWYIGWSNCHPGVAAKLRKLFPRPNFLPNDSSSSAIDWIFIGSPGLGASMHIDYVKRPSWQAQLSGVKRWLLHPPPECESVCPESLSFTIYPGDLLFLETNTWYHQTFIEGNEMSISIGSEYD